MFWPKSPPLLGAAAPAPPNRFDAGLAAALFEPPNKPPEAGAVLPPPPNNPPLAGADVVAGVAALLPNNPPVDGVVELAPPKRPGPEAAGVVEVLFEAAAPPNSPPDGFGALPNKEPAVLVGVLLLPAAEAPAVPNENEGGALVALAFALPNSPPDAGADVVALFEAAPDELGAPNVNDMMAERDVEASSMCRRSRDRSICIE